MYKCDTYYKENKFYAFILKYISNFILRFIKINNRQLINVLKLDKSSKNCFFQAKTGRLATLILRSNNILSEMSRIVFVESIICHNYTTCSPSLLRIATWNALLNIRIKSIPFIKTTKANQFIFLFLCHI